MLTGAGKAESLQKGRSRARGHRHQFMHSEGSRRGREPRSPESRCRQQGDGGGSGQLLFPPVKEEASTPNELPTRVGRDTAHVTQDDRGAQVQRETPQKWCLNKCVKKWSLTFQASPSQNSKQHGKPDDVTREMREPDPPMLRQEQAELPLNHHRREDSNRYLSRCILPAH